MSQYEPVYDTINTDPPTEADKFIDKTLEDYMAQEIKLESDEEMERRNKILAEVQRVFQGWVRQVAIDVANIPEDEAAETGGQLFVSGSHRLRVREPGADIDTVCAAPRFCQREHFFTSLKERFLAHPDVQNFNAIESAAVPIMSFDIRGVNIDLLFARLNMNSVPADLNILDDKILKNLDTATEKSLNGPRVTDMIVRLVPNYENFLVVLRCIRRWAKRRGLYGNKLGYFGGVNFNIMVAFVCQLYPNASPSSLLARFFRVYNQWKWPNPIMLNRIQPNPPGENREVWSKDAYPFHLMPIITPAYPAMNSTVSVNMHTRDIIQQEIKLANEIIQLIIREKGAHWERLFAPSDFFVKYDHYLCCNLIGVVDDAASRGWIGFVESRLRRLSDYLAQKLPLETLHLFPMKFKTAKSAYSCCYFIGIRVDKARLKEDKTLYLDRCVDDFRKLELGRYSGEMEEGMEFTVEHLPWKKLPGEVFESIGGKSYAKMLRDLKKSELQPATDRKAPVTSDKEKKEIDTSNAVDTVPMTPATESKKEMRKRKRGSAGETPHDLAKVQPEAFGNNLDPEAAIYLEPYTPEWTKKRVNRIPHVTWALLDAK